MSNNSSPFEVIIAAPITLWIAPVGTAKPAIDVVTPPLFTMVGSSGNLNYDDSAGVEVEHSQQTVLWRSLGDSGARKAVRTSEDLKIRVTLVDMTLEQYALALNGNSVTTVAPTAGVVGYRTVGLSRGLTVDTRALLIRSNSPYGDDFVSQYFVPRAAQTGNPTIKNVKGAPAMLALEWTALVDPDATDPSERFGVLESQDLDS